MGLKVAIQGIQGSFHHQAVQKLFPKTRISLLTCNSFEAVTDAVIDARANYGIIAVENTIVGPILPNYALIDTGNFEILAETVLNVQLFAMALPNESINDIREIHSHPVALLQCRNYLNRFPKSFKVIEGKDTASEAKRIADEKLTGIATIAGKQVAAKYGLKILDRNVQDLQENHTRFVLLGKKEKRFGDKVNKACLKSELTKCG